MPPSQRWQDGTLVLHFQGRLDFERTTQRWEDISARLREPGLARRSGSSFAAKNASMKVRQELDVLAVMNMDIIKLLVLPRVLAIALVTPLLIVPFLGPKSQ